MLYKLLIILHLLGAATWVGGHIVLVRAVLPRARREDRADRVLEFEAAYGPIGLGSLVLQTATGVWLATYWTGDLRQILSSSAPPAAHLVLTKLALLLVIWVLAASAYHRVLPRLQAGSNAGLSAFARHAWAVTIVSVLMLIVGAGIRTGGLL